jgi:hypothetical protein
VHHGGQIAAVVENEIERLPVRKEQALFDAPVELLQRLAFPCINGDTGLGDGGCYF